MYKLDEVQSNTLESLFHVLALSVFVQDYMIVNNSVCLVFLCRECQVKHWSKHKPACKLMAEAIQRLQEELNISS